MSFQTKLTGVGAAVLLSLAAHSADAFQHTVRPQETLASLSTVYYGTPQMERVLVVANGLDHSAPSALEPGMILEIPGPRYHRVEPGDTWDSLAERLLGHKKRATTLASTNDSQPWVPPETGRVISIPYNLSWVLSGEESLQTLAYRYMGSNKFAWELMQYNLLTKTELPRGRVLLIPLKELKLTPEAEAEAQLAAELGRPEVLLDQLAQGGASRELADLKAEIYAGLYVHALGRLGTLRGRGGLSLPQNIELSRLELEVLVALGVEGPIKEACNRFREADPGFHFDPVLTSPKIIRACPERLPTPAP